MNNISKHSRKVSVLLALALLLPFAGTASEGQDTATVSYFSNALFNTLLVVIIILAIMVTTLSKALKNITGSDLFTEKLKREKEKKNSGAVKTGVLLAFLGLLSNPVGATSVLATVATSVTPSSAGIGGIDYYTFYIMCTVIFLELITLFVLFATFKKILGYEAPVVLATEKQKVKEPSLFEKMNYTVSIEEEGTIMLDHDYDGIKELDNNLPPWWKYGFYFTILVCILYMINYHIIKTGPLQGEEYKQSVTQAEIEIAEYMKTSANNVDETSVKMLSSENDIATGKEMFITSCAACHGRGGEGGVGPNLTDEYWLHGGSIQDIFKTIKYGWPDKGMKSWKEEYTPMQMAQLSSFIRTLKGTNPANPKDKQGELYTEEVVTPSDSTAVKSDSTFVATPDTTKLGSH